MILFLDPSSTCIGWAVFRPDGGGELVAFGRIKAPSRFDGRVCERLPWMAGQMNALCATPAYQTITRVVLEVTSGKVARGGRARGMNGAGLGTYGMGVGVVWGWLLGREIEAEPVLENVWTRGRSKESRQLSVAHRHRGYVAADDPGMDVSDAISLGEWWFVERALAGRKAQVR